MGEFYRTVNIKTFGATYGCDAYGAGVFNAEGECVTATSPSSASDTLANTGIVVAGILTIACVLLLLAIVIRVWRRPAKPNESPQPLPQSDSPKDDNPPQTQQ